MRSPAILVGRSSWLLPALLAARVGAYQDENRLRIRKCCDEHQALSGDGWSCEDARWPGNFSISKNLYKLVIPPLDGEWVRRWLPLGAPVHAISHVNLRSLTRIPTDTLSPVNASSVFVWEGGVLEKESPNRYTVNFHKNQLVARPKPGGGLRWAEYCVDAAQAPSSPFALQFRTECTSEECAHKCCRGGELLNENEARWTCEKDSEGYWPPKKSSAADLDPEFPYQDNRLCDHPRLLPFEKRYVQWSRSSGGAHNFPFSTWHTCFDFYRGGNGSLKEGLFYCEFSRTTRGAYWLLRPLSFLSALLLTGSLLSVACDKSMRRKIHGRCLASHAACLLAFNIGQIGYFFAISDRFDEQGKSDSRTDFETECAYFGCTCHA